VHFLGQRVPDEGQKPGSIAIEDSQLATAVRAKDRKATAEFVARYADSVYGYIHARLAPRYDQVEDLVQDVFLSAWENLERYRGAGPLGAWVMGIARHKVEDYYRGRLRAPESIDDPERVAVVPAATPEIHEFLEQAELRKKTWEVLRDLSEQHRLALIWRYWDKASAREMAQKTGKSEKAIERLLARAREEFRGRWKHGQ
jgi:RNA polymerase sigma-70 factor (ECF subfamily)